MTVTVWWKDGEDRFTDFEKISNVAYSTDNPAIMYLIKDDGSAIHVNVNEVLYIEEETE